MESHSGNPFVPVPWNTVDVIGLHNALSLPLKMVRASLLAEPAQRLGSPWLRYCKKCLRQGKKLVAELSLDKAILQDVASKKWGGPR